MSKSKSFKKILIFLAVIAVAFIALFYFVYADIKSKNEKVSVLEASLSQQDDKQGYVLSTKRTIQSLSDDLTQVNSSIVSTDGDVKFIESLEALARKNGLTIEIQSLTLDDTTLNSDSITILNIKAKTTGGWNGMYTFLADIESLPLKVRVSRFDLANAQADSVGVDKKASSSGVWQGLIDMSVLKYK